MYRNLISLAAAILLTVGTATAATTGDWKIHSTLGSTMTRVIDTPSLVYYVSTNSLYRYDKATGVTASLNARNTLSDTSVGNIYRNEDEEFIIVTYTDANIDYIYDDGRVFNVSDLKDAIMKESKTINEVLFADGRTYVATAFGYLILDNEQHRVVEMRNYGTGVKYVFPLSGKLLLGANNAMYWSDLDGRHSSLSEMSSYSLNYSKVLPISDTKFVGCTSSRIYLVGFNADKTGIAATTVTGDYTFTAYDENEGIVYLTTKDNKLVKLSSDASSVERVITLSTAQAAAKISSCNNGQSFWLGDASGVKEVSLTDAGAETVLTPYAKPEASAVTRPYLMAYDDQNDLLYVCDRASTQWWSEYYLVTYLDTYDGSTWRTVGYPWNTTMTNKNLVAPNAIALDPDDKSKVYLAAQFDGVHLVKNGIDTRLYDNTNSPLKKPWACLCAGLDFDGQKNLWVVSGTSASDRVIAVLPRNKQDQDVTAADWIVVDIPGFVCTKKISFVACKKSNYKVLTNGTYNSTLTVFDDNGTPGDASDDRTVVISNFIDQNEKPFSPYYINDLMEDERGRVWAASTDGAFYFNPADAFGDSPRMTRPQIIADDGSIQGYLMEGELVMSMSKDNEGRKWFGTQTNGVFYTNADGSRLYNQFNTSNSYLPDDYVVEVACNPKTGGVFIGTRNRGMVEYNPTTLPMEENYDNVYAFPDPVAPSFNGWITIYGLMNNSVVRIVDGNGTVVSSGTSNGGVYYWNGLDADGNRVATGRYTIRAGQSASSLRTVASVNVVK